MAIEKLETEWKEYPIFHLDFNGPNYKEDGKFEEKLNDYLAKWERDYGLATDSKVDSSIRFSNILSVAHEQTGLKCVVLVDEYDKPFLDVLGSGLMVDVNENRITMEERNRDIMKAFYSTLKLVDEDL